jgi:hypothetical protein
MILTDQQRTLLNNIYKYTAYLHAIKRKYANKVDCDEALDASLTVEYMLLSHSKYFRLLKRLENNNDALLLKVLLDGLLDKKTNEFANVVELIEQLPVLVADESFKESLKRLETNYQLNMIAKSLVVLPFIIVVIALIILNSPYWLLAIIPIALVAVDRLAEQHFKIVNLNDVIKDLDAGEPEKYVKIDGKELKSSVYLKDNPGAAFVSDCALVDATSLRLKFFHSTTHNKSGQTLSSELQANFNHCFLSSS